MTHPLQLVLILMFALGFLILLLWVSNIKDRLLRYHQFLAAAIAPLYAIIILVLFAVGAFPTFLSWIQGYWEDILATTLSSRNIWLDALKPFTLFWLFILFYILIKRLLIWALKSKIISQDAPAINYKIYEEKDKRVLLKNSYYYPLRYMYYSAIAFTIVYCITFFSYVIEQPLPAFGLFLVFIFLEMYWFLNGQSELEEIEIKKTQTRASKEIDFYPLWKEYRDTWSDNLGISFVKQSKYTDWSPTNIGGEMLIKNYKKNAIFQNLHKHIVTLLNKGKKIIIFIPDNYQPLSKLEESEMYINIKEIVFGFDFTSQFVTTDLMDLKFDSSIFITSIDSFLQQTVNIEEDNELFNWFKNLRLVIYFGYDISLIESPESSVSASSIIKYLSGDPNDLTSIVFAEDREAQQASWKSNLKTNPQRDREVKINDSESENTYYLGWKGEKYFESGLFNNYANRYVGPLTSLTGLPYSYGIEEVDIKPNNDPFIENYENSISNKDDWKPRYQNLQLLINEDLFDYINIHHHNLSITHTDEKVLIVNDNYYNAPFLYKYYNEFGRKKHLINIISPPHILREYFNDNFEYFSKNPIKPLSYMLIPGDKFTLALSLIEKLVKCKVSLQELAQDFSEIEHEEIIVTKQLRKLFNEAYNFDIINTSYLLVTESENGEIYFSLKTDIKDQIELFKKVEFKDMNNSLVFSKNKNLLFQKYLPGQMHTFGGRTYAIRRVSDMGDNIFVRLESTEPKQNFTYTEKRRVQLHPNSKWERIESKNPTSEYALNIFSKGFTVSTSGYFELNDGNSLAKRRYTFHELEDVYDRVYPYGRVCKISFANYSSIPKFWGANLTLRIVLEELIKVLFPDSYHYLIVRCFANEREVQDNIISHYYTLDNILETEDNNQAGIYIFEDSIFDMGHLKSIVENIDYIFKILDDYFEYIMEKAQNKKFPLKNLKEHSKDTNEYFLAFELSKIKTLTDFPYPIDIKSAKNLTRKCLRVHNDITFDRWNKKIPKGPVKQTFLGPCHCCQKPNCKEENAELFDDGRIICNDCKKAYRRNKTQEEYLIDIAKSFFNAAQPLPLEITVRFTNLHEICMKGASVTNRFPHAAIRINKVSRNYEILIENYRKDLETCMGLVHAFTHVWQMENLDVKRIDSETKFLEGLAFIMVEKFLTQEDLEANLKQDDPEKCLESLKIYKINAFPRAAQQLQKDSKKKDLFLFLSMSYSSTKHEDFVLVDC